MAGKKNGKSKKSKPAASVDLRTLPKDKRPKPTTGQSAAERELPYEELSTTEKELVEALDGKGKGERITRSVEWLADLVDGKNAKLQVRNALRRPVACGWVEWVERGQYRITDKGRRRLGRV